MSLIIGQHSFIKGEATCIIHLLNIVGCEDIQGKGAMFYSIELCLLSKYLSQVYVNFGGFVT